MLPDHLVPARFHISESDAQRKKEEENSTALPADETTFADIESDIMCGKSWAGQTRNVISEERDRHIKERINTVVKIETFAKVLNGLLLEQEIKPEELDKLLSEKTAEINAAGNEIWVNLLTREKTAPFFYQLEE
ncbi:hypothetical protein [Siccibacter turicensis]|uniref:Uncharacterized protein n=1 Tax=Siccibacter turicensis TaxID=357233 RepID=A0A2P8VH20_9ENTR|nr:hypothetical protein [Siccibacter turicensis]MDY0971466.1 hypothetical protein [Siccibacter turicensis]PSN06814.1 hypothetical protein C7G83_14510 [Siccibacter turicensis]